MKKIKNFHQKKLCKIKKKLHKTLILENNHLNKKINLKVSRLMKMNNNNLFRKALLDSPHNEFLAHFQL